MEELAVDDVAVTSVARFVAQSQGHLYDGGELGPLAWSNSDENDSRGEPLFTLEKELARLDNVYESALMELNNVFTDIAADEQDDMIEMGDLATDSISCNGDALYSLYQKANSLRRLCVEAAETMRGLLASLKGSTQAQSLNELQETLETRQFVRMKELENLTDDICDKYSERTGKILGRPENIQQNVWAWKAGWLLVAGAVMVGVLLLPVSGLAKNTAAIRCVALVSFVLVLWVTEALPFYVTAMAIPVLTVLLRIYELPAQAAAHRVFSHMFNHTTALVLGGFSLSSAFSKYGFEKRLINVMQRRLGDRPRLFLLSVMAMGWFFSMWISNVAASVLSVSVVMPILHSLPTDCAYVKATLLGLALACNTGGMLSPISSPQNAIALGTMTEQGVPISFVHWLAVSIPFCLVLLVGAWAFLLAVLKPTFPTSLPATTYTPTPLGAFEWIVIVTSIVTIFLWCTLGLTENVLGDMGIVAFVPLIVFLSTGVLTKDDFQAFGWNLVMLIAGGNVLGAAVEESRLLDIIAQGVLPHLRHLSAWSAFAAVMTLCVAVTTPLSHTVGAIVLIPMVVTMGRELGQPQVLALGAVFMFSGAMALPTSSFPNINSLLAEDMRGRPYLHAIDFVKYAGLFSLITLGLCLTLGYLLLIAVLS